MKRLFALALVLSFVMVSCGGRVPPPQTAHGKVIRHFEKYGKKNKESDFGQHPVQRVEIASIREVQKNVADVEAYAYLDDGSVYKVRVTLRKKTFGWRVVSWETLAKA